LDFSKVECSQSRTVYFRRENECPENLTDQLTDQLHEAGFCYRNQYLTCQQRISWHNTEPEQIQNSSVDMLAGYGLDGWGLIPSGTRNFSLFYSVETGIGVHLVSCIMDIWGLYPQGKSGQSVKLNTLVRVVLRSRITDIPPLPICHHDMVLN
jgi:hypothetical protein